VPFRILQAHQAAKGENGGKGQIGIAIGGLQEHHRIGGQEGSGQQGHATRDTVFPPEPKAPEADRGQVEREHQLGTRQDFALKQGECGDLEHHVQRIAHAKQPPLPPCVQFAFERNPVSLDGPAGSRVIGGIGPAHGQGECNQQQHPECAP
jgi:hypothetical protein